MVQPIGEKEMAAPVAVTFNLEYGCEKFGVSKIASLIADSGASVALLQETKTSNGSHDCTLQLSSYLGWYSVTFSKSATAIIATEPVTKIAEGEHFGVAKVGANLYACVVHFTDYPYLPFEASSIRYPSECRGRECFFSTDAVVLQNRSFTHRQPALQELNRALSQLPQHGAIILGGDFNEPSHRDWTPEAVKAGLAPFPINFPTTSIIEHLGFGDCFRLVHPDVVKDPGTTWPDRDPGYDFRRDRIDFIFVKNMRPQSADVISSSLSDHSMVRAVVIAA